MKIASRLLLPSLLLSAPVALAQETPAPSPAAEAPAATPAAAKAINVSFRGTLRDALKRIAEDGGLNVVATGELDTSVEVHLEGVTAPQALRTIARTYSLRLDEDGSIFTLRPMTAAEKNAAQQASTQPQVSPPMPPMPAIPAMPEMPPMPAMPSVAFSPPGVAADAMDPQELKERVRDHVRRAQRKGPRGQGVVARGQSLEVKESETVDNAVVYGGDLTVKGHVEEDAVVFSGNLDIYGHVDGDAHAFGGNVVLHPGAVVEGDVSSIGGTVTRHDGSEVEGSIESFGGGQVGALVASEVKNSLKQEPVVEEQAEVSRKKHGGGGGIAGFILRFAALFGLGFLGQLFFPARMKELSAEIKNQPLKSGLTGLLGILAMVPITAVLAITLIGIPVAVVLWLLIPVVASLGLAVLASEIGLRVPVLRGRKTQAMVLALGLFILLTVGAIPGIGPVVMTLATLVAFGAVIRTRLGNRPPRGIPEPLSAPVA
jgi:cytoskeletal protein CcmA (bactofilin family)